MLVLLPVIVFIVIVVAIYLYAKSKTVAEARKIFEGWRDRELQLLEERARSIAINMFEEWKQRELENLKKVLEEGIRKEYEAKLQH
jgi:Endonuclease related to archaeal Holliday junction resolvase.